jgi:hypothetical protein
MVCGKLAFNGVISLVVLAGIALAQVESPKSKPTVTAGPGESTSIARIRSARTRVEAYVQKVKSYEQPADETYQQAQELYIEAYGAYDGWLAALKSAIVEGKAKKLPNDGEYKKLSDAAEQASSKFIDYAAKLPPKQPKRNAIAILSALGDLGIKLWSTYQTSATDRRKVAAEYIEKETKWRDWDSIPKISHIRETNKSQTDSSTEKEKDKLPPKN